MNWKHKLSPAALRKAEGSLFIAPWVFGLLAFVAYPLGYSFYMSFHQVQITVSGIQATPVGFQYYREILMSDGGLLYDDLIPFLKQAALMLPIILIFSLLLAIFLNLKFPGRMIFRVIFFLPVLFSSGQIIQELINQGEGGLAAASAFRLDVFLETYLPHSWSDPLLNVLNSFVLVLWYSGVQIMIFLAGRQTIPSAVYEASRMDGADPWSAFWKITLPGLAPFIFLNLIYTIVDLFMFPSNPIISKVNTENYGVSSALAWIYFLIVLLFLGLAVLVFGRATRTRKER